MMLILETGMVSELLTEVQTTRKGATRENGCEEPGFHEFLPNPQYQESFNCECLSRPRWFHTQTWQVRYHPWPLRRRAW